MRDFEAAELLIKCLDLTSLNKNDNETNITKLCKKAVTPYGNVAAVCVYPKFIPVVQKNLEDTDIKIASVVNFPEGGTNFKNIKEEIKKALGLGADEIDAVFPYKSFLNGDEKACNDFLEVVVKECKDKTTKIILETGELKRSTLIAKAAKMCIEHGVTFIKTSTGKSEISATPEAANVILETIAQTVSDTGFKASGGIKTFEDARKYLVLSQVILGQNWAAPEHFRIGASSLLDDLLKTIEDWY
jgi:deoxyribose-phosphate aldolase